MNKKVFFVAFTALACLGISARADDILSPRTVTGHGVSSDANPSCGEAPGEAEQDADQDALSQCKTAGIQRIGDYTSPRIATLTGYMDSAVQAPNISASTGLALSTVASSDRPKARRLRTGDEPVHADRINGVSGSGKRA